jgi:serine/threonine-protein kinase
MSTLSKAPLATAETVLSRQSSSLFTQESVSPIQNDVDQLVSGSLKEASNESTFLALLGAGWAFRYTRAGLLSLGSLSEGKPLFSSLVRGGSYALALASESSTFVGIDGGIRHLEGEAFPQDFKKEWIKAAVNLGGLKLFAGLSSTQNLVVQHLFTDLSLVTGQRLAFVAGLTERPQGSWAEQMLQAESLNWSMKAGMELLWGLSPSLFSSERSLDLRLRLQNSLFSIRKPGDFPFSAQLALASSLRSEMPSPSPKESGDTRGIRVMQMSSRGSSRGDDPEDPTLIMEPSVQVSSIPQPGDLIGGRYEVEKYLGKGAMGAVYLCQDKKLPKKVAMKLLTASYSQDPTVLERFYNEMELASSLHHPHITNVSDFGSLDDGTPYFIMEYHAGKPLADVLQNRTPLPADRLINIARQLAVGLEVAHRAGVVHRDIKPENIFLLDQDFVKILDFGIAKVSGKPNITQAGLVFGTPWYLSPEGIQGQSVDQRSDIYSFGVLLYEMAAGQVPFQAEELQGILTAHIAVPPPSLDAMATRPIELPRGLEALIMKCLAKNPAERYQSMEEVIADLEKIKAGVLPRAAIEMAEKTAIIESVRIPSRYDTISGPPRSRWPLVAGLAGSGAVIAVLAALLVMKKSETTPQVTPPTPDAMPPKPPPPTAPDAAQPPPPVVKKTVTLTIQPADAHAFLADKDLGPSPVKIEIEEGISTEIEIRRKGFKSSTITLDGSQEKSSVRLERERSGNPTRPPRPPNNPNNPNDHPNPPNNPNDLDNPWKKKNPKNQGSGSKN